MALRQMVLLETRATLLHKMALRVELRDRFESKVPMLLKPLPRVTHMSSLDAADTRHFLWSASINSLLVITLSRIELNDRRK